MDQIKELAALLNASKDTLALTGAGVSTESGIPDFRSPGTGLWSQLDPMELFSRAALDRDPQLFWQRGQAIFREMASAEPNPSHHALAAMEAGGVIRGIVTQNIDSLHQRAGSQTVLEVHGHLRTARCPECGGQVELLALLAGIAAAKTAGRCGCGGFYRPEVVLFGDQLPQSFTVAWQWSRVCDLLLVVGSSLEVAPVCWLAAHAKQLAIINLGPTPYDDLAKIRIRGKAGAVLTEVLAAVNESSSA